MRVVDDVDCSDWQCLAPANCGCGSWTLMTSHSSLMTCCSLPFASSTTLASSTHSTSTMTYSSLTYLSHALRPSLNRISDDCRRFSSQVFASLRFCVRRLVQYDILNYFHLFYFTLLLLFYLRDHRGIKFDMYGSDLYKCDLCCRPVSVRPSVRLSVCHVRIQTAHYIVKHLPQPGSSSILFF